MLRIIYNLATDKYKGLIFILPKTVLLFFSLIYGFVIRLVIFFRSLNKEKFDCKIISVGNITLGGTGKTPLVEYIAKVLIKQGKRVAIVSRGYKSKTIHSQSIGDEPMMLEAKLNIPVIVGAVRKAAIKKAIKDYSADTVILDDGFQQWGIKKDLEIVTIDATNPFGNRNMIPRGIMRQPISTLKSADIFVLTKTDYVDDLNKVRDLVNRINYQAMVISSVHSPVCFNDLRDGKIMDLNSFRSQAVALVSAIADPGSFKNLILKLGLKVEAEFIFMDHHAYSEDDLRHVAEVLKKKNIDLLITTGKDSVKLKQKTELSNLRVLALNMELKIIDDQERFYHRLLSLYSL